MIELRLRRSIPWILAAMIVCSCAPYRRGRSVGVPIESRPTPAQPDSTGVVPSQHRAPAAPATPSRSPESIRQRVASDTLAASARVRRCAGRKLLPDQEGVYDGTLQLLADVRAAIAAGDWNRAESLARRARQLSSSLVCR